MRRYWGFDTLRPLQRESILAALAGRDSLTVLPTGGGKSLCYQAPPLVTGRLTVVVSPLIALMKDQADGLRLAGYPGAALHSNLSDSERAEIRALVTAGELRLLLVSPERLLADGFLAWLKNRSIGAFAVDEAHCISQWGHDFRPEYRRLAELRDHFPGTPIHAFTATATPRVQHDIVAQLKLQNAVVSIGVFDRPNLTYRVLPRLDRLRQVGEAVARHKDAACIVYCISRKDTESLAEGLREQGLGAQAYHAGLDSAIRTRVSDDFRAERLSVVVATVAFGMGIDRGDVRLVVHAAMPKSVEHYQQETGRAGRDGLPAECLLLYSAADGAKWRQIVERSAGELGSQPEVVAAQLELLGHMQRLVNTARCRHRAISAYFGQDLPGDDCGACDYCLKELQSVAEGHETAQKILSAVVRCGQNYGAKHLIDVLRGQATQRVRDRGHDKLSTFGLLPSTPSHQLASYIDQLIDAGDLERTPGEMPVLRLTARSAEVLKSQRKALLVEPKADLGEPARRGRAGGPGTAPAEARALSGPERGLFDSLRALRRELAEELGVPPYVVFGDTTLEELARVRPSGAAAMSGVRGVGARKLEQFGARFLASIAEYCAAQGLSLDAEEGSRRRAR